MEVVNYSQQNGSQRHSPHDKLLDDIINNLQIIGIDFWTRIFRELLLVENGEIIGSIDVLVQTPTGFYIIEAKASDVSTPPRNIRRSIRNQLNRYSAYFARKSLVVHRSIGVFRYEGKKEVYYFESGQPIKPNPPPNANIIMAEFYRRNEKARHSSSLQGYDFNPLY